MRREKTLKKTFFSHFLDRDILKAINFFLDFFLIVFVLQSRQTQILFLIIIF